MCACMCWRRSSLAGKRPGTARRSTMLHRRVSGRGRATRESPKGTPQEPHPVAARESVLIARRPPLSRKRCGEGIEARRMVHSFGQILWGEPAIHVRSQANAVTVAHDAGDVLHMSDTVGDRRAASLDQKLRKEVQS